MNRINKCLLLFVRFCVACVGAYLVMFICVRLFGDVASSSDVEEGNMIWDLLVARIGDLESVEKKEIFLRPRKSSLGISVYGPTDRQIQSRILAALSEIKRERNYTRRMYVEFYRGRKEHQHSLERRVTIESVLKNCFSGQSELEGPSV